MQDSPFYNSIDITWKEHGKRNASTVWDCYVDGVYVGNLSAPFSW